MRYAKPARLAEASGTVNKRKESVMQSRREKPDQRRKELQNARHIMKGRKYV